MILYLCPVLVQLFVPWVILHVFLLLADFFKIKFFEKKIFQKYHQSVKQNVGPDLGLLVVMFNYYFQRVGSIGGGHA